MSLPALFRDQYGQPTTTFLISRGITVFLVIAGLIAVIIFFRFG